MFPVVRWAARTASRTQRGRHLVDAVKLARSSGRAVRAALVAGPARQPAAAPDKKLAARHRELRRRYGILADRLAFSSRRSQELSERVHDLAARNRELSDRVRELALRDKTAADRFAEFLGGTNVILPARRLEDHLRRVSRSAGPEALARYREHLERTGYRQLYEQVFGEELLFVRSLDPRSLREHTTFARGESDVRRAEQRGLSLLEMNGNKLRVTHEVLTRLVHDADFKEPPRRICEIGGGWGATIKHLRDRYAPEEYQNYEIDTAYGAWAERELGAKAMPVDGETLAATQDASIDFVIANNALYFMPPIKVFSYLSEMARVLDLGGLAMFNLIVADRFDAGMLRSYLTRRFPRRAFSLVPQHFVDLAFPESGFELVRTQYSNDDSIHLPYYTYRRVA